MALWTSAVCLSLPLFLRIEWICRPYLYLHPLPIARAPWVVVEAHNANEEMAANDAQRERIILPNTRSASQSVAYLPSRWKISVIDRTFLDQLSAPTSDSRSLKWPPLITQIPEPFDDPTRFLFPARISEQEYKARS